MHLQSTRTTKRPSFWLTLPVLAILFGLLATPIGAAELSKRTAKKTLKDAADAAARGDHVKARELYEQVAEGTKKIPDRRADALYALLMLEAALPAGERDEALLTSTLAQFEKDFARDVRHPSVNALAALHRDLGAQQEEIAKLLVRSETAEAELEQKVEKSAGASKDATRKIEELEARLRRSASEVENLKADLAKKEEALQKLKKVVVGSGG